jgi:predicted ATPase
MKLASFQILNCFGFRDSGEVNFINSNNLIYILGRNSSGKSSLLNAINYFEIGKTPSEMRNFVNFNKSNNNPLLKAKFTFEKTKLNKDNFLKNISSKLEKINIDENIRTSIPKIKEFFDQSLTIYNDLIDELNSDEKVEIQKLSDGSYHFIQDDFNKYKTRKAKILELIDNAKDPNGNFVAYGSNRKLEASFNTFEDSLFLQFPKIYIFNEEYSLNSSLPDKIIRNWKTRDDKFEKRFVEYLGEDKVNRFLIADDPEEREELLKNLRENIDKLVKRINENRSTEEKTDLLEMRLDASNDGIQITVKTDGKKSFFSHLSDNTKFLFAYHLYAETENINGNILLFDEPNNGFHPTAQKKMLRFLQDLGKKGSQVIVSTHSEYLIDPDYLSGVRLMSSDENKNTYVKPHFYNQTGAKGDFYALQPIFDAIGFKYGNQLEIKNNVIITEGVTDLLYLRAFNKILKFNLDLNIAPARGEGMIPHIVSFLISQGLNFKILIDTGQIKTHIENDFGIASKFFHEIPIPNQYAGTTDGSGIEDLFSKIDFEMLLKEIGHVPTRQFPHKSNSSYMKSSDATKALKRIVANHLYENVASFKKAKFEKETLENFQIALEFCKSNDWFSL